MSNGKLDFVDQLLTALDASVHAFSVCEAGNGWRLALPAMDDPLIHFVLKGEGRIVWPGGSIRVDEESFAIIPPRTPHALETSQQASKEKKGLEDCTALPDGMIKMKADAGDEGDRRAVVTTCGAITARYGGTLGLFDNLHTPLHVVRGEAEIIAQAFHRLVDELSDPQIGTRALTSALLKQCLVLLVRRGLLDPAADDSWMLTLKDPNLGRAVALMLDSPAADVSVDDLADRAALSRSVFTRRFSEAFGVSPIEFLTLVRLNRAAALLAETKLPVKVVADSVGYASRSHFSRAFKSQFGDDPSAFRAAFGGGDPKRWQPVSLLTSLWRKAGRRR